MFSPAADHALYYEALLSVSICELAAVAAVVIAGVQSEFTGAGSRENWVGVPYRMGHQDGTAVRRSTAVRVHSFPLQQFIVSSSLMQTEAACPIIRDRDWNEHRNHGNRGILEKESCY